MLAPEEWLSGKFDTKWQEENLVNHDFVSCIRLCRRASRLNQQGFKRTLLLKSFNKFFKHHGGYFREVKYYTAADETCIQVLSGAAISFVNLIISVSFQLV